MALQSAKKFLKHKRFPILVQFVLVVVGLASVFYSGNRMLKEPLWGYLPLTFFLGIWMIGNVIIGLLSKKRTNQKYLLLSIISGFLLFIGFPDPSITPAIFLGFIPLLYIAEDQIDKEKGARSVFRYAFSAFFLWNVLTTFWVANTSFAPSIFAFGLNSLFMCIPFVGYFKFRKKFPLKLSLIAFVVFWITFEMIHLRWEISWPWLTLGNAFSSRSLWIQWYEFTGHIGGSVWVLAMNALLFYVYTRIVDTKEMHPVLMLYPMLLLMAPILISFFIYFNYQEKGNPVNVTLIQPNFEPHYQKFELPQEVQMDRFIELSENNIADTTDYLVFPETSFSFFNIDKLTEHRPIQKLYSIIDSFPNTNLITGLVSYKIFDSKEKGVANLRPINSPDGQRYMQVQNSAVELSSTQDEYDVHVKGKLVPGAEIFPYSKLLFFLEPIIKKAGGSTAGHARTNNPKPLTLGKASPAAAICYESIYAYWMRKFVLNGADLFFVITNDGWWDNTPGHRQHLAFSILRAIEFRRSIGRSANSGVSCVIDQHGSVYQPLAYNSAGAINATLFANDEITFYAKNGDILGRIAYLLTLILLAFQFRLRFKNK